MEGLTTEYHSKDSPKLGYGSVYDQVERDYWHSKYDYTQPRTKPYAATSTFEELKDYLKSLDEVTLLEILDINSEDIVDKFEDKIEEKQDSLFTEVEVAA